jgi:hypothetical protein
MKGIFFQKPYEFGLRIEGEAWNQGDLISGELTIKNPGDEPLNSSGFKVCLTYGDLKKVRAKTEDCFDVLGSADLTRSYSWSFKLDRNSPITDGSSSLFVAYGNGDALEKIGLLQLIVHPDRIIQDFLDVLKTDFRFVVRTQKMNKAMVEIKLVPPASRSFATLEHLMLSFQFKGDVLDAHYLFHTKKVEASAASVDLKKEKKQLKQSIPPDAYRLPNGRFNHEKVGSLIQEALNLVESKFGFT